MSEREGTQPLSPEEQNLLEIRRSSELFDAFFNPHEDLERWDKRLYKKARPIREKLTDRHPEALNIFTDSIYYVGYNSGFFNPEYNTEERLFLLQRLGINLMFMSYESSVKRLSHLFVGIANPFYEKVRSLPLVKPGVDDKTLSLYTGQSLSLSHRLRKIIETSDPKSTVVFGKKKEVPEFTWEPPSEVMREFLEGLDLDGFTGERP